MEHGLARGPSCADLFARPEAYDEFSSDPEEQDGLCGLTRFDVASILQTVELSNSGGNDGASSGFGSGLRGGDGCAGRLGAGGWAGE